MMEILPILGKLSAPAPPTTLSFRCRPDGDGDMGCSGSLPRHDNAVSWFERGGGQFSEINIISTQAEKPWTFSPPTSTAMELQMLFRIGRRQQDSLVPQILGAKGSFLEQLVLPSYVEAPPRSMPPIWTAMGTRMSTLLQTRMR